jgi:hypothetical protein
MSKLSKNCLYCNKEYSCKDNYAYKNQKYCSPSCQYVALKNKFIQQALKNFEQYRNQTIGRLTILEYDFDKSTGPKRSYYKTKCECGEIKSIRSDSIKISSENGCYKCGTFKYGISRKGLSHTPTFTIWKGMMQRCYSETSFNFYLYGARGIKVSERWHDFEKFLEDMGERPSEENKGKASKYHIDRINPDGDYEPGNCRWISASENQKNRRNIHKNGYVFIKKDSLCSECLSKTYNINLKD